MKYRRLESDPSQPILSRLRSMLTLNRQRIHEMLADVTPEMLDFTPDIDQIETIGTLLEHIAAVDAGWIFEDVGGEEIEYERYKYGFPLRSWSEVGQRTGKSKEYYLEHIDQTREEILAYLDRFSDENLHQEFIADEIVNFTLEWLMFHLINHEAMHLGQISLLKRLYRLEVQNN